jgi:hypothetical protein
LTQENNFVYPSFEILEVELKKDIEENGVLKKTEFYKANYYYEETGFEKVKKERVTKRKQIRKIYRSSVEEHKVIHFGKIQTEKVNLILSKNHNQFIKYSLKKSITKGKRDKIIEFEIEAKNLTYPESGQTSSNSTTNFLKSYQSFLKHSKTQEKPEEWSPTHISFFPIFHTSFSQLYPEPSNNNHSILYPLLITISPDNANRRFQIHNYKFEKIELPYPFAELHQEGFFISKGDLGDDYPNVSLRNTKVYSISQKFFEQNFGNQNFCKILPNVQTSLLDTAQGRFKKAKKLEFFGNEEMKILLSFQNEGSLSVNGETLKVKFTDDNSHRTRHKRPRNRNKNSNEFLEIDRNSFEDFKTILCLKRIQTMKFIKFEVNCLKDSKKNFGNVDEFIPEKYQLTKGSAYNVQNQTIEIGNFRGNSLFGKGEKKFPKEKFITSIKSQKFECGLLMKQASIFYKNGSVYKGEVKFSVRHGKGEMKYKDGQIYKGEWRFGWKHGHGTQIWQNGNLGKYEGTWLFGRMHGFGMLELQDGSKFEGVFEYQEWQLYGCWRR